MQKYTYSSPIFKNSTKLVDVKNQQGNVVCKFKRNYKNLLIRMVSFVWDFDWNVQIDVYSNDRETVYQCIKNTKWVGKPTYKVINCLTSEEYDVSYISWQKVYPEFRITNKKTEYVVKKDIMDWAKVYHHGKEVARWKMKTTELFNTYLEIKEECPIQEPEFFVCLFQTILVVGD